MIFKHVIIFDCGFLKWVGLIYQYGLVIQKHFEVSKNQIRLIFQTPPDSIKFLFLISNKFKLLLTISKKKEKKKNEKEKEKKKLYLFWWKQNLQRPMPINCPLSVTGRNYLDPPPPRHHRYSKAKAWTKRK